MNFAHLIRAVASERQSTWNERPACILFWSSSLARANRARLEPYYRRRPV